MKKLLILSGLALSLCAGFANTATAQVHINVSIGAPVAQQQWYGNDDDYYYMPDEGVYYNTVRRVYVYPEGGRWMYAGNLPDRYRGCSWNGARSYRIRGRAPFERDGYYRQQYAQGYDRRGYGGGNPHDYGRSNGWNNGRRDNDNRPNGGGYSHGSNGYNNNNGHNSYSNGNNGYNNGNGGGYNNGNNNGNHGYHGGR